MKKPARHTLGVQVRIMGPNEAFVREAMERLTEVIWTHFPRKGKRGNDWIAYGVMPIQEGT